MTCYTEANPAEGCRARRNQEKLQVPQTHFAASGENSPFYLARRFDAKASRSLSWHLYKSGNNEMK